MHLTGITPALSPSARATVESAVERARAAGVTVSLDLNYRAALWRRAEFAATMRALVPRADIVFGSAHEVADVVGVTITGPTDAGTEAVVGEAGSLAHALADLGPTRAVVTLGGRGAVAFVDGREHLCPARSIALVDGVGAGDAFVAGWLAEELAGRDVEHRLRTATACGAFACTVSGDWEGMPTRPDLARLDLPAHDPVAR